MKSRGERVACALSMGCALMMMGCSGQDDERAALPLSEAEITIVRGASTTVRHARVSYEGDTGRLKEIAFLLNGADAGRMEAHYSGDKLTSVDVIDSDGDRGDIMFSYGENRVKGMQFNAPSVYTMAQEYEYDDARSGAPREVTTRFTPTSGTAQTSYRRFDHDDKLRLERITDIAGQTTSVVELRHDEIDRIERATSYAETTVVDTYDYAYDDAGRLESVTTLAGDRWDIRYADDGAIEEVRAISPRADETTTIRYRYGSGAIVGLHFTPDLPQGGLFDLRGETQRTVDFLALAPAALSATVPSSSGGGGGDGGGDDPLTCGPYTAQSECDFCDFTYCCPQVEVCAESTECYPFWDCAAQCQDADCYQQCGAMYPAGRAEYESYYYCSTNYCNAQCGW